MNLDRAAVVRALSPVLTRGPAAEVRLVGTASSVLRGIEMPANDIDVLFHDRAGVDAWFTAMSPDYDVESAPTWLDGTSQYFARVQADGVTVELSTVEIETDHDTMECFGAGPWRYFDVVACGEAAIPAVATELRLLTEFARERDDRFRPLLDHLRVDGCDAALIRRGLTNLGVAQADVERLLRHLDPDAVW